MPRFKNGLTLIELLVVISIIGILASLATFTYQDSQQKSRDSRRKSDLDALKKAIELAKQDSAGSYSYPICDGDTTGAAANGSADDRCRVDNADNIKQGSTALATTYIKEIPKDPKDNLGYYYNPEPSTGTGTCTTGACPTFNLVACLENSKDQGKESVTDPLCTARGFPASFRITNL